MIDIELPEEIQELIDSHDENRREVENRASDTLCSVEIPIFGILRDFTAQKCYQVLCRLRDWFGTTPTKQHYLCLMMVTDYISCSYNHTNFYGTFVKERQDKFYESFFLKLSNEWKTLFYKLPIAELPSLDQFNSLQNSLRVSFARFPKKFTFRWLLIEIMSACDEYATRLEKHLSDLKAKQDLKINVAILNNLSPVLTSNGNTIVRISSNSKSAAISVPYRVIHKPTTPNAMRNLISNHLVKRDASPSTRHVHEPKKIDFGAPLPKVAINPPAVIVIDESPVKMDKTQSKLDNITNLVSSKGIKRPAETCEVPKPLNLNNTQMECQKGGAVSNANKDPLPRKLNAFDILMRRKFVKTVS